MTGTIDERIYPHGLDSYDTSFDLRRHMMIRTNAYTAYKHDQLPAQGTVVHGDATSVVTTIGAVDQDDASTKVDDDMDMRPTSTKGRD